MFCLGERLIYWDGVSLTDADGLFELWTKDSERHSMICMTKNLCFSTVCCAALALMLAAHAQEDNAGAMREKNKARVSDFDRKNAEVYGGRTDVLLKPGLVADATARMVKFLAECTKLKPDETVEFFVISEDSGHDYEALAISFAKPSDIHNALEFIGLAPGEPANEQKRRFWPKGERVVMTFSCYNSEGPSGPAVRVERLVHDRRRGGTLPDAGLVFVGSAMVPSRSDPSRQEYAADTRDPNSIASDYNEPFTVLDIPFRAPQHSVYEERRASEAFRFEPYSLLEVTIRPEYPKEKRRVRDLRLVAEPQPGTAGRSLGELALALRDENGATLNDSLSLNDVLRTVSELVDQGIDPFVAVEFSSNTTVKAARELCVVLSAVDTEKGMRIEPPPPGHLYYQAFIPEESFRDRASRVTQPWELALNRADAGIAAVVTHIEQIWKDDEIKPDLKVTEYQVNSPSDFSDVLEKHGPGIPVILVFADAAITHGELMAYVGPVLSKYPTIYVFVEERSEASAADRK